MIQSTFTMYSKEGAEHVFVVSGKDVTEHEEEKKRLQMQGYSYERPATGNGAAGSDGLEEHQYYEDILGYVVGQRFEKRENKDMPVVWLYSTHPEVKRYIVAVYYDQLDGLPFGKNIKVDIESRQPPEKEEALRRGIFHEYLIRVVCKKDFHPDGTPKYAQGSNRQMKSFVRVVEDLTGAPAARNDAANDAPVASDDDAPVALDGLSPLAMRYVSQARAWDMNSGGETISNVIAPNKKVSPYGFLCWQIDEVCGKGSHGPVLSAICGRTINKDNLPGKQMRFLIEDLLSKDEDFKRSVHAALKEVAGRVAAPA